MVKKAKSAALLVPESNKKAKAVAEAKKVVKKAKEQATASVAVKKAKVNPISKKAPAKTASATARPARAPLPQFEAPSDFKSHFVEVRFKTELDGLVATHMKLLHVKGRYNFEDPSQIDEKKISEVNKYSPQTVWGVASRLGGVTYKPTNDKKYDVNPAKRVAAKGSQRLPASTMFAMILRVNRRSKDGTISVLVKAVYQIAASKKSGVVKRILLTKEDPVYRLIRKCARVMPAAFTDVLMPPKRTRRRADADSEE